MTNKLPPEVKLEAYASDAKTSKRETLNNIYNRGHALPGEVDLSNPLVSRDGEMKYILDHSDVRWNTRNRQWEDKSGSQYSLDDAVAENYRNYQKRKNLGYGLKNANNDHPDLIQHQRKHIGRLKRDHFVPPLFSDLPEKLNNRHKLKSKKETVEDGSPKTWGNSFDEYMKIHEPNIVQAAAPQWLQDRLKDTRTKDQIELDNSLNVGIGQLMTPTKID